MPMKCGLASWAMSAPSLYARAGRAGRGYGASGEAARTSPVTPSTTASNAAGPLSNRIIILPLLFTDLPDALTDEVRPDREHDDQADQNHLDERGDVQQIQPVAQDGDHQDPEERPRQAPLPATQAGAADHHRGDGVELLALADRRLPGKRAGGENEARGGGEHPREQVRHPLVPP